MEEFGLLQLADAADAGDVVPLGRVHADYLHTGIVFLEEAAHAGDGAAGAETGDKVSDGALRLTPDLWSGGPVVGVGVGLIAVLVADAESI